MKTIETIEDAELVSASFNIPISEVVFIELNRTGIWLSKGQVPVSFRVRFSYNDKFSKKPPLYFAVPVKNKIETAFFVNEDDQLMLSSHVLGGVSDLEIDTCDCSYFRKNKMVLNLNSNQRGNCSGCAYCVHNYPIYDSRVLKDRQKLSSKASIREFLKNEIIAKNRFVNLAHLDQIAIVTGLFAGEKAIVRHIGNVREVASEFGFQGPIFFLGSELRSKSALVEVKKYQPFSLCYAIDCFTDRNHRLVKRKSNYSIPQIIQTLSWALESGFETTFAYIVGLDPLKDVFEWVNKLRQCINRFPIVNIYQIQHPDQNRIVASGADKLDYFLKTRKIFESIFLPTLLRPHNWENYRSLWTHWFGNEFLIE